MKAKCYECKEKATKLDDNCVQKECDCDIEDFKLSSLDPTMKYIRFVGKKYARVPSSMAIFKYSDNSSYFIGDSVGKTFEGDTVYGTSYISRDTSAFLETLMASERKAKEELGDTKEKLGEATGKLTTMEEELQGVKGQLKEANEELKKTNLTLYETSVQLTEAIAKLMESKAEIGHQVLEKAALVTETTKEMKEMEERGRLREEEIRRESKEGVEMLEARIMYILETKNEVEKEKTEATREAEELRQAFSIANDRLHDAEMINDFRKQQCLRAETLLAQRDISFQKYKEQVKEESREFKDQIATLSTNNASLQLAIRQLTENLVSTSEKKENAKKMGSEKKSVDEAKTGKTNGKMKVLDGDEMDKEMDA